MSPPPCVRTLLFLVVCIGLRSALVYAARIASPSFLKIMGAMALIPALGFWIIFMIGARKTGPEVFGEPIWWNALRPVHGTMYLLFAIAALQASSKAWVFLLCDVLLGVAAYAAKRFGAL